MLEIAPPEFQHSSRRHRASLMILKFAITDELPMDRLIGIFLPLIALR